MKRAEAAGDTQKVEMYRDLVFSARDAADHYTHQIESEQPVQDLQEQHQDVADNDEADAALSALRERLDDSAEGRCPDCGQFSGADHSCPAPGFADSMVRNEDGTLATMHHGSSVEFDSWDAEHTGTGNDAWGSGFYFTDDEDRAKGYGEHLHAVHLNITNPIMVDGKAHAHLDEQMEFTAEQSSQILRSHPDIYRQPDDEEEMNPLGDYVPEYWDKDHHSREEMDRMIDSTARQYYDDVPWSHLEGVFPGGKSENFRQAVRDVTGHDGVVTDFGQDGKHYIAWFPDQVQAADTESSTTSRCPNCGQFQSGSHACPAPSREALNDWRDGLTDDEREAHSLYGSVAHIDLNEKLRDAAGEMPDNLTQDEQQIVQGMDSALERAPRSDEHYTVHRGIVTQYAGKGVSGQQWVEQNAQVGQEITLNGYTSTTLDPDQARYFAGADQEVVESGVVFEVETTQGANWGSSGPEAEVTLARNTRFEVTGVDESNEIDGKSYPVVRLREKEGLGGFEHPLAAAEAEPMKFGYLRNTVSSTEHSINHYFGQDIEPSGRYMVDGDGVNDPQPGWETGTVQFDKPLHMEFGGSYSEEGNWKQRLSTHYDGKTGQELSQALRDDGYDAIITRDEYGTSEVVDLTGSTPAPAASPKPQPGKWDRRRKYTPRDSRDFGSALSERHGVEVELSGGPDKDSYVVLNKIAVPEDRRGTGMGKKVMSEVVAEADRNGWQMGLTPDDEWGSSVPRLKRFYKEFGFVENKGRSRDFATRESMIRPPK